jgi:large subunit ribosomal protein L21
MVEYLSRVLKAFKRFQPPYDSETYKIEEQFMYAVIETGGKQYRVKEGDEIYIEKLDAEGEIEFDKVVLVSKDDEIVVGTPHVKGAVVKAAIIKTGKAKKLTVFTYKPKKGQKRKLGHRQPYTKVKIEAINY